MVTDELTELMRAAEVPSAGPDLDRIRRQGRHRRWARRASAGTAAAVVVGLVTTAVALGGARLGAPDRVAPAAEPHRVTGLSEFEKRVLDQVPSAYAVDGTVVIPGVAIAGRMNSESLSRSQISGAVRSLGFHAPVGQSYLELSPRPPDYLRDNLPRGSQVVLDPGPAWIGCVRSQGNPCDVSVLGKNTEDRLYRMYGLGTEDFLRPGAPMQVFTDEDYSDRIYRPTVIGGFAGTEATSVELTLVDGTRVPATVDSGTIREGATLFWARPPAEVAKVTAYDADGAVLASHTLRACRGAVDCEVR